MLNEFEKEKITEELKNYPYPGAACIDVLKIVQESRGWISDEAVADIAEFLRLPEGEVSSVASFYSRIYRKPTGRNIILVCESVSCMIMRYESLYNYISKKLGICFGETTTDNRFTLLPNSCLGDCDNAPAMMINNDHYNRLSINKIDKILEKYK